MIFIWLSFFLSSPLHVWPFVTDTEDFYIEHLGTNKTWDKVRNWFAHERIDEVKKYCAEIHKRAGKGTIIVGNVTIEEKTLSFTQEQYKPRQVDVLSYTIDNSKEDRTYEYYVEPNDGRPLNITQGWRPDCIYYVTSFNGSKADELRLDKPVCAVPE